MILNVSTNEKITPVSWKSHHWQAHAHTQNQQTESRQMSWMFRVWVRFYQTFYHRPTNNNIITGSQPSTDLQKIIEYSKIGAHSYYRMQSDQRSQQSRPRSFHNRCKHSGLQRRRRRQGTANLDIALLIRVLFAMHGRQIIIQKETEGICQKTNWEMWYCWRSLFGYYGTDAKESGEIL